MITLAEVKTLLQLTDTTKDTIIAAVLPEARAKVDAYCNSSFSNGIYVEADTISFTAAAGQASATINDSVVGFVDAGFASGYARVSGSYYNDGIFAVSAVAGGALSVSDVLVSESAGATIRISRVNYPQGIKHAAAMLVKWMIERSGKLETSESLPGYSVTYKTEAEIMAPFNQYRRVFR
jgi:hypothetical protein